MTVLMWNKPGQIRTSLEHAERYQADGAPPGTYVPNMSDVDAQRWRAKIVGTKSGNPQVEIRKTLHGTQILLVVSATGRIWQGGGRFAGGSFRLSANGVMVFTAADWEELHTAIFEALMELRLKHGVGLEDDDGEG